MKRETIKAAVHAIDAFMLAVEALDARIKTDTEFSRYVFLTGSKETATLRRRSMDLTRALAEMRKYN